MRYYYNIYFLPKAHTHVILLYTHTEVVSAEACSSFSQSGCGIVVPGSIYQKRAGSASIHPLAAVLSLQTITDIILLEVSIQTNCFKLCSCWCYHLHSFSVKPRPASPQAGFRGVVSCLSHNTKCIYVIALNQMANSEVQRDVALVLYFTLTEPEVMEVIATQIYSCSTLHTMMQSCVPYKHD